MLPEGPAIYIYRVISPQVATEQVVDLYDHLIAEQIALKQEAETETWQNC